MLFKRKRQRPPDARTEPTIQFLSEQDGPIERQFKAELLPALRRAGANRAYLARATFQGSAQSGVVLCLAARESLSLVNEVSAIFGTIFGPHEHVDIVFIADGTQEAALAAVCPPFFVAEEAAPDA
jgi:hypothetical protein